MSEETTYGWTFTGPVFNLAKTNQGEPYSDVVSEAHATEIGLILILWAQYETFLNEFSEKVFLKEGVSSKRWKALPYKKRADLMLASFDPRGNMPKTKHLLSQVVEKSKSLQDMRNACAHGVYSWTSRPEGTPPQINMIPIVHIRAEPESDRPAYNLSVDDLETARLAVSNIAGKLGGLAKPVGNKWLESVISASEIDSLRALID